MHFYEYHTGKITKNCFQFVEIAGNQIKNLTDMPKCGIL